MPFLPDVVQLGPFPLAMVALTGLFGGVLAYLLAGRGFGAPAEQAGKGYAAGAQDLIINIAIGGFLGAKVVYIALDPGAYIASPALLAMFPYGPLALPAGLAGAAAALLLTLRLQPGQRLQVLDQAAVPLALGIAVATAGWKAPGSWAFAPLLLAAVLIAAVAARRDRFRPGQLAAATATLVACALVVADIARPEAGIVAGISPLQLAAALIGTATWRWTQITPET